MYMHMHMCVLTSKTELDKRTLRYHPTHARAAMAVSKSWRSTS